MKYLLMCEGTDELEIINILLKNNALIFSVDDLVSLRAFHSRQIERTPMVMSALRDCTDDVEILRIGDTLKEKLRIPREFKDKIKDIKRYCTKPELERIVIIAAGLEKEYQKCKSNCKPKQFAKMNKLRVCGVNYSNSSTFFSKSFGSNPELLINTIYEYRRVSKHEYDECYLADLIVSKNDVRL